MTLEHSLMHFEVICNGDTQLFFSKLCTEYRRPLSIAKGAFAEYIKFIYLLSLHPQHLVPSKIIDKVWHLPMTFTLSYWHDLCDQLLGKEIHHHPYSDTKALGLSNEKNYAKTLALYAQTFSEPAPNTYWPTPVKASTTSRPWRLVAIASVLLLTACSIISGDELEYYFKWAIGLYVVYRLFKWLGSGNNKGGGHCNGGFSCCGGD